MDINLDKLFEPGLTRELDACKKMNLPVQSYITTAGNSLRYTPIVLQGAIKVARADKDGREILMYHILPGESCIISITSSLKRDFANMEALVAVTGKPTKIILISDAQIKDWHNRYPSWRRYVTDLYDERLTEIFDLVDEIAFKSVDQRLKRLLLQSCDVHRNVQTTHQEIAIQLGTAREVVSRLLKRMEHNGNLKLKRGCIHVIKL